VSESTFDCNEIEELLPEYVLGMLDADEVAEVAHHLQDCPRHIMALESYQEICNAMCFDVPQIDPPAHLKQRVMASIASVASPTHSMRARAPLSRIRVAWAVAAVAFVAAVLLGVWGANLQNELSQVMDVRQNFSEFVAQAQTRMVALHTMPQGGTAKGVVFIHGSRAAIWALGLPELEAGEVYKCWWFDAQQQRTGGGSFTTRSGSTVWYMDLPFDSTELRTVVITREPAEVKDEPLGPGVMSGDF